LTGIRATAAAVALGIAAASCGGGSGSEAGPSPSATATATATSIARPSSPARLTIVSPGNGETVQGPTVELRVDLRDARIVPQTTTDLAPDEGHLHVLLDDTLISMTEGLDQTIPDVAPGLHRLTVEFVAADHAPFDPRVVEVVAFEVTA
jgi:Family of unknown function (DUF6130)